MTANEKEILPEVDAEGQGQEPAPKAVKIEIPELGHHSGFDFDNLSRSDMNMIARAMRSPKLIDIPDHFLTIGAAALFKAFLQAKSPRVKATAFKALLAACQHNTEVAKYFAIINKAREQAQAETAPVSLPGAQDSNLPAIEHQPQEETAQERRKKLMDVPSALKEIASNHELRQIAEAYQEKKALDRSLTHQPGDP